MDQLWVLYEIHLANTSMLFLAAISMTFSSLLLGFRHKNEKGKGKLEKKHDRNVMGWGRGGRLGAAGQTLTVICFATPTGLAPASSSPVMTATCFRDQRASLARE